MCSAEWLCTNPTCEDYGVILLLTQESEREDCERCGAEMEPTTADDVWACSAPHG